MPGGSASAAASARPPPPPDSCRFIGAVTGTPAHPETVLLGRRTPDGDLRLVARGTPLAPPRRALLAERMSSAGPGHPWHGMRVSSHGGSHDRLDSTPVAPRLVAEFEGDTAVDRGRRRQPVRLHRLRTDLTPEDVPAPSVEGEAARAPRTHRAPG
ncbi:hypothetical protein ACFT5C_17940 [Streptomyces sp. NPDC057116]|uniref:hypothetical protein n=1 Tax=Streptomyces sp. NPDC057116 TaxID=3346023 RepID=UPI00363E6782